MYLLGLDEHDLSGLPIHCTVSSVFHDMEEGLHFIGGGITDPN